MSNSRTLANYVGTNLLPFMNPRVVCPPGEPVAQGRPNIVVATPKRSGTHVLIDTLLNNIPAYRNRPLYIDLDQCWKQGTERNDLVGRITPDMGYILKTHLPIGLPPAVAEDTRLHALIRRAVVVTVRRNRDEVARSMKRWVGADTGAGSQFAEEYEAFWAFWEGQPQIAVAFEDLFAPDYMAMLLDQLCEQTGARRTRRYLGPPNAAQHRRIYLNKTLTRLAGRHAPRIDTTIHTLKR